jgi:hypothetical protein
MLVHIILVIDDSAIQLEIDPLWFELTTEIEPSHDSKCASDHEFLLSVWIDLTFIFFHKDKNQDHVSPVQHHIDPILRSLKRVA